ncbi:MAG TPA: polyprenol monophosphomannose synthase [Roseiflexaceae bacterium]|jgi:dolichol-phosphate mannosyltransferase|nr:polyprenol monophosphomannose synthase [Roseiflexaceae bacterium]
MWSNQHKFSYSTLLPWRASVPHADQPASVIPNPIADVLIPPGRSQRYCLVVVPTYNEAQNIVRLIAEVLAQGPQFDVLVVDDNSPDGTGNLVAALAARMPRVRLLCRAGKLGLGSAYLAGFRDGLRQGYVFLCEMDADFSHQPRDLPSLLHAAEHDADVALGSRNMPGGRAENWSWARKALSRGGSLYARTILAMPVRDCTGGFKCFRASALHQLDLDAIHSNGYAFQVELNYRCYQAGFRIREVPIVFPNRVAGTSKMSWRIVWEAIVLVWKLRLSQTLINREVT